MYISKWEVVLGAPDRVIIPCLMHDPCLCEFDAKQLAQKQKDIKPVMI